MNGIVGKVRATSLEETEKQAETALISMHEIAESFGYSKALVVGLSGDLGSGKTTFSQFAAKLLGVEARITSPTFVIEKIYKTKDVGKFETFIHIDAYRLEDGAELDTLGFKNILSQPNTLIFIEWPERVIGILPEGMMNIKFEFIDEKTREISY